MSYTVFRGTEFPRLDRLSGKPRWIGGPRCQMVLCSVGSPQIVSDVFGIQMDALECREIPPVVISGGMAVSVSHPDFQRPYVAPMPVSVQHHQPITPGPAATFTEQLGGRGKSIRDLVPGDWFVARCPTTGQDYVCCYIDRGMSVEFGPGRDVFLSDMEGLDVVIPVKVSISYQRANGDDPRRN
jgi:hypothetical protein